MKRFMLCAALALLSVAPASACNFFDWFGCHPAPCQPCGQPVRHTTVYYAPPSDYQPQPIYATSPGVPQIILPPGYLPSCPNGRCPNPGR